MPKHPEDTRPLSPHLQVYKPQLTSVLSITHRGSGVFLSFGTLLLALCLVALATGYDNFRYIQQHLVSWYGLLAMSGWIGAFSYHMCNGIRHLFWDAGLGLELDSAYRSGAAVLLASVVLSAVFILRLLSAVGAL